MAALAHKSTLATWLRDSTVWRATVDLFAILTAASLPWSTSLTAIFAGAMLVCFVPHLDLNSFLKSLSRPVCVAPIALFLLALLGMLWSDAAWSEQLRAVNPTAKLLVLPVLLYHFERSSSGRWVFIAFLASCALLSVMSWLVLFDPSLSIKADSGQPGIFVKNYIDQSQEFALCAVALAFPVVKLLREKKFWLAGLLTVIGLGFLVNMAFVIVSRTAIVTMPIMFAAFVLLHLEWRSILLIFGSLAVLSLLAWQTSPPLRAKVDSFTSQYRLYKDQGVSTSVGLRLEFWRKSLSFFAEAPVKGHGTGTTRSLFELAATGPHDQASSEVISNPHNQTLNVAVQWGLIGIVILYAMWFLHLRLVRGYGFANWIGFLVVVQNIFTSLFNSHLFDFHEGWMYVLGFGVAGGMVMKARRINSKVGESSP